MKQNVVFILPDIEAGVAQIVRNIIAYHSKENIFTKVILFKASNLVSTLPEAKEFQANEVIRFRYNSKENLFYVYKRLAKHIESQQDIIVANDGFEIRMCIALKLQNPLVYILHGDFKYYYKIIQAYHPIIDKIITYSNTTYAKTASFIQEIHKNQVVKEYYPHPLVSNIITIEEKKVSAEKFKIVFVGSLDTRKGAHLLPQVFEIVQKKHPNAELDIYGEGELMPSLKNRLKNNSKATLHGWVDKETITSALKKATIFLFPSEGEGLPNVLVEALSMRAVPVCTNLKSGIDDIIQHQINGVLIDNIIEEDFATAIIELFNDDNKLEMLISNAHKNLDKFLPEQQANEYINLILNSMVNYSQKLERYEMVSKKMGGVLNNKIFPNQIVKLIRSFIKNPSI